MPSFAGRAIVRRKASGGTAREERVGIKQFGRRQFSGPPERRETNREPMPIAVSLYSVGLSRVVLMLDVSTTGARFKGHSLPEVGKDVMLIAADVELFGRVVRCEEGEAAIHFERPIGPDELAILQRVLEEQSQVIMNDAR
jgi:hypothetical protein